MIPTNKKIIYVTRDIERALGMAPHENYRIVTNKTPYGEEIKRQYPDFVTLIENPAKDLYGTTELLSHPQFSKLNPASVEPGTGRDSALMVFKNSLRVESVITANKWTVLNPKASIAEKVENKLSQVRWLGELGSKYLPSHTSKIAKFITWKNDPFVIQWAHGHTGDGTILIRTRDDLSAVQAKFPERMARLSTYIQGPSFTVNVVIGKNRILMGNLSYQITGLPPFTDNEFSTVGNDWAVASKLLSDSNMAAIRSIVQDVGTKLVQDGWRGLFGVDLIRDDKTGRMYLIEINARQPASTTFESNLQEKARQGGAAGLTTFEAHILALLGELGDQNIIAISDGAQIVQRVTKNIQGVFDDVGTALTKSGFNVISYQNSHPNDDLIRAQSQTGIMEQHGTFNEKGRQIMETIKSSRFNIEI